MDFKVVVQKRREITKFTNEVISTEKLEDIIHQAYLSPTGNNLPSKRIYHNKKSKNIRLFI